AAGPSGRPCWPGDLPACPRPADVDLANSPRLWSLHRGESGKSANSPRWSDHKRRFLPAAQRHRQRCVTVATSATTSAMAESWAATIGSWRVREADEDGRWDRETSSTSRRQALSEV